MLRQFLGAVALACAILTASHGTAQARRHHADIVRPVYNAERDYHPVYALRATTGRPVTRKYKRRQFKRKAPVIYRTIRRVIPGTFVMKVPLPRPRPRAADALRTLDAAVSPIKLAAARAWASARSEACGLVASLELGQCLPPDVATDLAIEEAKQPPPRDVVIAQARAYLVRTATPGGTMTRQGADVAIGRLHPVFAVRLARAVKEARDSGLKRAGCFSAYRPPAFRVGGYRDKFRSNHAAGLACDMAGVGYAGSRPMLIWHRIAAKHGVYMPYGPYNRAEANHAQLVPERGTTPALRRTITAKGPISLVNMWTASRVSPERIEPPAPIPVRVAEARPRKTLARRHRTARVHHGRKHRYARVWKLKHKRRYAAG